MTVFDETGNLVNKRARATIRVIDAEVDKLYKTLLKQGMTIVEGRALADALQGGVSIAAMLNLLHAQCK